MKRYILLIILCVLGSIRLSAQQKIILHNSGQVMYESSVSEIDSIKLQNVSSVFNFRDGTNVGIPISQIDSITFEEEVSNPTQDDVVYITYNGSTVEILNPYEDDGITVTSSGSYVTVNAVSGLENIEYSISGNSSDGSFSISSDKSIILTLNNISLSNLSGTTINIADDVSVTIKLLGNSNELYDSDNGKSATLLSKGDLIFQGQGRLIISGYKKHAISSDKTIVINSGTVVIPQAASDGFHAEAFEMNGGFLDIQAEGDGIDAGSGTIDINNGIIKVVSTAADVKGIKCDDVMTINGGIIDLTISGAQSKGFSSKKDLIVNSGNISIVTSGAAVLEASGSGNDPSYCTAIKTKGDIIVNNGNIIIECQSTADGGKGFSADGSIKIYDGYITVSTAGNGATYTNEEGVKDSYTSCCIKSDVDISLLGGVISCSSTGTGGKGISADGILTIGSLNMDNDLLKLDVTTSGERFYVSGSGNNADYANPKAIKSEGNLTVNSGIITINCTQKDEGGEGLESKDTLTVNGGIIEIHAYDDCINASNHITINGGTIYCVSTGNDGIDSNGTLSISGGFTISSGTRSPEAGFDCDQSRFAITGGIVIGTGGSTSNPTANASTQYSIKYTGTPGNAICIKNANDKIILLYEMPTYTSSGGNNPGGPGGNMGGNNMVLLFSDPDLQTGQYTLQYGGSISGGTTVNGYNSGGTYSSGTSKSFTISSMVTTVN